MGTAVAKRTATAVKLKPIADVVRQIKTHIYDANNAEARCVKHRLQAGQLLLQLRERIESGEAGNGINWWEWCEQHIERSRKDCETLLRIANAPDPEAAALGDRERVRLAVAKHRKRKAAEPPVTVTANEDDDDDDANTGCNYDPADPRGKEEGEGIKVIRRRAWLVMAAESQSMAESFTACSGHRAIVGATPARLTTRFWPGLGTLFRLGPLPSPSLRKNEPRRPRTGEARGPWTIAYQKIAGVNDDLQTSRHDPAPDCRT